MQGLYLATQSVGAYGGVAATFLLLAVLAAAIRIGYLYAAKPDENEKSHRAA